MPKKEGEMKLTSPQATIFAALIAVVGIIIGSFLTPLAEWLINKPTTNSRALTIEQIPFTVFPYGGDSNPSCCVGQGSMGFKNNSNLQPIYSLDYNLPENETRLGYSGLAFTFEQSQNLSEYYAIEFNIFFGDGINQSDINLKDITFKDIAFHVTGNANQWNTIVVPLTNFIGVDLKAVQVIEFEVLSNYTTGNHRFEISNIQFIKK